MVKWIVVKIIQPGTKVYWCDHNRFSSDITEAFPFDTREEAIEKSTEIEKITGDNCDVEKYVIKTWGIRKADGSLDWKKLGIAVSIFVTLILFGLLLVPQLLKVYEDSSKLTLWIESVKYCIEKWIPIASIELSAMGVMGVVGANNSSNNSTENQ